MQFFYVKMPWSPRLRAGLDHLHAALDLALSEAGVGVLVSWGDSVSDPQPDGLRRDTHHRLDIELADGDAALVRLRELLAALPAPEGTQLHGSGADGPWHQRLGPQGWGEPLPGD